MQLLIDAGIRFRNGKIEFDYRHERGNEEQLRLKDTPENRARLEAFIAQRGLTVDDLRFPKAHRDDRPLRQRISEDGTVWRNNDQPKSKADILRDTLNVHNEVRSKVSWEENMQRQIDAAEIEAELALEESERLAKAEPRIEHATWGFLELAYSDCPQSEITSAAKRLQIAREGTGVEYRAADKEFRERQKLAALNAKMLAEQQFQQAQKDHETKTASLESAAWTETPNEATSVD